MMSIGMKIQQCSFSEEQEVKVKNNNFLTGYTYEKGLYDRLIWEYEEITSKNGKRVTLKKW